VKLKAALEIIEMNQVKGMQGEALGRKQLAAFLKVLGLATEPMDLPDEYSQVLEQYGIEVIDINPEEVETPE
jgi:hypothetical protein